MSVLREFYNGNINPGDTLLSTKYAEKQNEIVQHEDNIRDKLGKSEETWTLLFDLSLATAALNAIASEENFICGFEIGARLINEITGVQL